MNIDSAILEQECRVFTRFLVRMEATPYLMEKYIDAHRVAEAFLTANDIDQILLATARVSPRLTQLADAYARLFSPKGVLRKKLVLLLAIIETSSFHRAVNNSTSHGFMIALLQLAMTGFVGVLAALGGLLVFAPLRLVRLRK